MASTTTTTRYPVKAKSLTLLELCQTINDLRQVSSKNTTQILTRRLYLHPLTISHNAKQHSSKLNANNLLDIEEFNQTISGRKKFSSKHYQSYRDLSVLSSSFPLSIRSNNKLNSSINSDRDSNGDCEASSTSISTNPVRLPRIPRKLISSSSSASSSSSKRTLPTRSPFVSIERKPKPVSNNERVEKIDVWRHLAQALQRPIPKDPPTTPLDIICDSQHENVPPKNYNSIQQIQIFKRKPNCDSIIDEED
jgi:hypothetical protein